RRGLLPVSDKRGLVDFARGLAELGIEIVSTGGTARELEGAGLAVRPIDDYTGFPEILDGRVKTLNPRIYAGLLAVRSNPGHVSTLAEHGIEPIDLVCVNLYPFERTSSRRGVSDTDVIENIDIGAPARVRVRDPGGGDHEAQQPLRRSGGRHDHRGVRPCARDRPAERIRRRLLLQPPGRPRARGAPAPDFRGAGVRTRLLRRRAR